MTAFRYSSSTLESIRFDAVPANRDRLDLLASGWEQHLYQPRLFLLKRQVRPLRLTTVASFVAPAEADAYDPDVLAALFNGA